VAPVAIVTGTAAAAGLLFYGFWDRASSAASGYTAVFTRDLERAGKTMSNERILIGIAGVTAVVWLVLVLLLHPPLPIAFVLFAAVLLASGLGFRMWLRRAAKARVNAFTEQIEMVLRMMANGLRVGLGLRQAIVLVTENLEDPARTEFLRVFAQTNIGVSLDDALAALAQRMPSEELAMMVSAIAVQSQTGGNLAKIFDHLAATIKGRRGVRRKIRALTGEAVAGAWVLGSLPVLTGLFIIGTQATMRAAMFTTTIGHIGTIVFVILEALGVFTLTRLMAFDV
jgi:tight adherence protein B